MATGATVGTKMGRWGVSLGGKEEVSYVGSPSPNKDSVRSEELAPPMEETSLSNKVQPTSDESETKVKEAISLRRSGRSSWTEENEKV